MNGTDAFNPNLTRNELEDLLEAAAERGAKKALRSVGLHDEKASKDISDVRSLLEAYREVKTSVMGTIGKAIGIAILGLLAFKSGIFWKGQ